MGEKKRVMVVDDEAIVGEQIEPSLKKAGYDVETFQDPKLALARFEEEPFDIVVTDVRMDDVDGIEVLEQVVAISHPQVIIITGYATMELAREAMGKDAFDFIAKPFKLGELRDIVNKAAAALDAK
jgi:DNA-binding NtrC family response regulator